MCDRPYQEWCTAQAVRRNVCVVLPTGGKKNHVDKLILQAHVSDSFTHVRESTTVAYQICFQALAKPLHKSELGNDLKTPLMLIPNTQSANVWPFRVRLGGPGQAAQPTQHQIGQNTQIWACRCSQYTLNTLHTKFQIVPWSFIFGPGSSSFASAEPRYRRAGVFSTLRISIESVKSTDSHKKESTAEVQHPESAPLVWFWSSPQINRA